MTDDPLSQPGLAQPVFDFVRASDRAHVRCELRIDREHGVEAQWFINDTLLISRRFATRALAVAWAMSEREAIEKGGA